MKLPPLPVRLPRRRLDPEAIAADRELLANIQGNIVRTHGRRRGLLVFFSFGSEAAENRRALTASLALVTSAEQQRLDAKARKRALARGLPSPQAPFASLALSAAGLRACGIAEADFPPGADRTAAAFAGGMAGDGALLGDPAVATWEETFRSGVHGVWQLAGEHAGVVHELWQRVRPWLHACGARVTGVDACFHWRPEPGARWECREPFGFADGISNPEFFEGLPANHWSVDLGLDRVLLEDAGAHTGGSFLVVRKLEQNVAAFRAFEAKLADALRAALPAERASEAARLAEGAIIGRDRAGVPLVGLEGGELNDFSFREDARASRCPFHAHIRKANPRSDDPYGPGIAPEDVLKFQFVRRGQVFGDPSKLTLHGPDWPTGGVGLWFIGYMRDIEEQFREMQARWMRDRHFPSSDGDGLPDPLLFGGENAVPEPVTEWAWAREGRRVCVGGLAQFVRLLGGEYFYVPPMRWLGAGGAAVNPKEA